MVCFFMALCETSLKVNHTYYLDEKGCNQVSWL
jgi:hypothetical protein